MSQASSIAAFTETTAQSSAARSEAGSATATAVAEPPEEAPSPSEISVEALRPGLIDLLSNRGQDTAADLLARGEWRLEGNQLSLRLPISEKLIDMTVSVDIKRLLIQEASRLCGRTIKLNLAGGSTAQSAPVERPRVANGNGAGGARERAAEDPIVRRMQEKFGAEVRTVVDLRQKK